MINLSAILQRKLLSGNLSIACAESLTSGRVQSLLSAESGASACFVGGVTAYNIDQKVNLLGVDRESAEVCNCVSVRTAREMSMGCAELLGADIAIATTGYAEPYPDAGITEPHAFISIFYGERGAFLSQRYTIPEGLSRHEAQQNVAEQALKLAIQAVDWQLARTPEAKAKAQMAFARGYSDEDDTPCP